MRFVDVSGVRSVFDEPVPAADGVRLSVDVYLPPEEGSHPVLITRTPYDNNRTNGYAFATTLAPSPADRFKLLAAHGFVVVACDVRGRGDSEGAFVPFEHEVADGRATVEWARRLSESNGRVGAFGSGYAGFTALAAASGSAVDAVAAWSPFGPDGTPFRAGAVRLEWLFWMHLCGGRTVQPVDVPRWDQIFRHRPLVTMHEALGRDDVPWVEWLQRGPQGLDVELGHGATVPTLLVTGWWDSALGSTMRYWDVLRGSGPHALMIGPWDTEAVRHPRADVGGVQWGPTAAVDPDELLIDWFRGHLTDAGTPPVGARVFVTGRNEWRRLDASAASAMTYWLRSEGRANTRRGDGRLASSPGDDPTPDRFTHDPDDPVPWQPGRATFSRSAAAFTLDMAFATARDDVLVYESDPVPAPLLIAGSPFVTLWAVSDADDADWAVAIEDVLPGGGRSVHLAHGIVRTGGLEPRRPSEVSIALTPVAHELLPGHVLRLLVASSLWPLYAVNPGSHDYLRATEARRSQHAVFHDRCFPSRLELPLAAGGLNSICETHIP